MVAMSEVKGVMPQADPHYHPSKGTADADDHAKKESADQGLAPEGA